MSRLPFPLVHSFLDAQGNFDALERRVACGVTSVTWDGSGRVSLRTDVAHGLGVIPSSVQLTSLGSSNVVYVVAGTPGPDDAAFGVIGNTLDGTTPARGTQQSVYWEARR